ncbi:MAG TPA: DUF1616 domain-containing protein [Methanomicrobia archaeon]|nr:DUF1616 domain-containing protein [Methanomicrobia archaeon]
MTRHDDLLSIAVLTAITIMAVVFDIEVVRQVVGIVFILFCPGYALIAALFTKKKDLDTIERIALSFGLSIAVVPLIGLGLNYTPWGIRLAPILVANTSFTFIMLAVALWRRLMTDEEDRFFVSFYVPEVDLGESRVDKALSVILIISIITALGALIYVIQAPKTGERFTEFYILGPGGMADDYPTDYVLGDTKQVILGIVNREYETVTYRAEMNLDGDVLWSKEYTLEHEEKIEEFVDITPPRMGEDMKLQFLLYKDGEEYRDLHLWITVTDE